MLYIDSPKYYHGCDVTQKPCSIETTYESRTLQRVREKRYWTTNIRKKILDGDCWISKPLKTKCLTRNICISYFVRFWPIKLLKPYNVLH